jgi:hypothetical protein
MYELAGDIIYRQLFRTVFGAVFFQARVHNDLPVRCRTFFCHVPQAGDDLWLQQLY